MRHHPPSYGDRCPFPLPNDSQIFSHLTMRVAEVVKNPGIRIPYMPIIVRQSRGCAFYLFIRAPNLISFRSAGTIHAGMVLADPEINQVWCARMNK